MDQKVSNGYYPKVNLLVRLAQLVTRGLSEVISPKIFLWQIWFVTKKHQAAYQRIAKKDQIKFRQLTKVCPYVIPSNNYLGTGKGRLLMKQTKAKDYFKFQFVLNWRIISPRWLEKSARGENWSEAVCGIRRGGGLSWGSWRPVLLPPLSATAHLTLTHLEVATPFHLFTISSSEYCHLHVTISCHHPQGPQPPGPEGWGSSLTLPSTWRSPPSQDLLTLSLYFHLLRDDHSPYLTISPSGVEPSSGRPGHCLDLLLLTSLPCTHGWPRD